MHCRCLCRIHQNTLCGKSNHFLFQNADKQDIRTKVSTHGLEGVCLIKTCKIHISSLFILSLMECAGCSTDKINSEIRKSTGSPSSQTKHKREEASKPDIKPIPDSKPNKPNLDGTCDFFYPTNPVSCNTGFLEISKYTAKDMSPSFNEDVLKENFSKRLEFFNADAVDTLFCDEKSDTCLIFFRTKNKVSMKRWCDWFMSDKNASAGVQMCQPDTISYPT